MTDEREQPEVFNTPDPIRQIGTVETDWARSTETTEHRRLREFYLYRMVLLNGEG
jgi:hypothetical protein